MKLKRPIDAGLYVVVFCLLLALVMAFSMQLRKGASTEQAASHYEEMKKPLPDVLPDVIADPLPATPPIIEPVKPPIAETKSVQKTPQRRILGRFFRWRKRR
tara:strand:- start:9651 stop:9956 length:306 start_codon:yes stop_codon:yes gene_type:complete